MGCGKPSKSQVVSPQPPPAPKPQEPKPVEPAPPAEPEQEKVPEKVSPKAPPKAPPFVKKARHQADPAIYLCLYFKISPDEFSAWKEKVDEFYGAARETEDLLSYSMAFNEGGVHIKQSYKNAEALLAHLRRAEFPKTEHSVLERVELHGPRRPLLKVKRHLHEIGDCTVQLFEMDKSMVSVRRPTQPSVTALHCDVTLLFNSREELEGVGPRLHMLHRQARDNPGGESFSITKCVEQRSIKLAAVMDGVNATLQHLAILRQSLGPAAWHHLQLHLHGADADVARVKELLRDGGEGLKDEQVAASKLAAHSIKLKKASSTVAVKAAASEGVKGLQEEMAGVLEGLQRKAEELGQELYRGIRQEAGVTEEKAKAWAKTAYKRAMATASQMRRAADDAASEVFDAAFAAGTSAERAAEDAHRAAEAAAREVREELQEEADAANEAVEAAKQAIEEAEDAVKNERVELTRLAREEARCCAMCLQISEDSLEAALCDKAKEARKAMASLYASLKQDAEEAIASTFERAEEAEGAMEDVFKLVRDRVRSAGWSVLSASHEVYYVAFEEELAARKSLEDAKQAAVRRAEEAAQKVTDMCKEAEDLAEDMVRSAEAAIKEGAQAFVSVLGRAMTYFVDTEKALVRRAQDAISHELHEAQMEASYAVNYVVGLVQDSYETVHDSITDRIHSWHVSLVEAEVSALKAVADAAEAKAEKVERKQRSLCC